MQTSFGHLRITALALAFWMGTIATTHAGDESDAFSPTDWPEFRGPSANGHAGESSAQCPAEFPLHWSETENVAWKIAIPHKGWSTPVVVEGQVWLTTATENGSDFYAMGMDAETGQEFYNERIFHCDDPEPLGNNINGYASPSPVIESGRLYVHFGSYGTACIDTKTRKVLWQRDDLECRHFRGPGSSPIVFENLLILTFDGVDVQYVTALDKRTGETVWKTNRSTVWNDLDDNGKPKRQGDFRKAFSTPLVVEVAGEPLMITLGSYNSFGYDPRTGREIWKISNSCYTPSARPVVHGELAYIMTGYGATELRAIRLDGKGDVTDTHVAWRLIGRENPDTPSPLVVGDLLYLLSNQGIVTCLETDTGEIVWSERIGGNYMASPIYAGGRLYFSTMQGKTTVLKPGRSFQHLATNELDAGFMASPAAAGNSLYLRTRTHLYRIDSDS